MKLKIIIIIIIISGFVITSLSFPQQQENIILNDIAGNISNYKNKTITLRLRFKNMDTTFDKIVFYDRKNIDIIFDIAELKKERAFKKQALNLHEGLEYYVVFIVKELTGKNNVIGDLKSFSPVILSKLPN
jgi:hypothetical protein